jgi:curved DNA-binding protein
MAVKFQDYYELLGVRRDASADEIHKAYRRLARQYHPDVNKSKDAEARFKRIGEAWEVMKDPEKRRRYDELGADWKAGQEFRPPTDWYEQTFQGGAGSRGGRTGRRRPRRGSGEADFSDFFETLFGGARSRSGFGGQARGAEDGHRFDPFADASAGSENGQHQEADITITLEDACRGATKTIRVTRTEPGADGRLRAVTHAYQVRIPRGTVTGSTIRLAGQGAPGAAGGAPGDLYLHVRVAEHSRFKVAGHDLTAELAIAPWEAALGASVRLPTVDGDVSLRIPPGSSSGRVLRLGGQGLPYGSGSDRGDLLVQLRIVVPETLTAEEKRLLEELAHVSRFKPRND